MHHTVFCKWVPLSKIWLVSLTSDLGRCIRIPGKRQAPAWNCLRPLPLPSAQEWWEKSSGWERSLSQPWPSKGLWSIQVRSLGCMIWGLAPPPYFSLQWENKQRKWSLLQICVVHSTRSRGLVYYWLGLMLTTPVHWIEEPVVWALNDPREAETVDSMQPFLPRDPPVCWCRLFPAAPPRTCRHLLPCTPVQYGNVVSEWCVFGGWVSHLYPRLAQHNMKTKGKAGSHSRKGLAEGLTNSLVFSKGLTGTHRQPGMYFGLFFTTMQGAKFASGNGSTTVFPRLYAPLGSPCCPSLPFPDMFICFYTRSKARCKQHMKRED